MTACAPSTPVPQSTSDRDGLPGSRYTWESCESYTNTYIETVIFALAPTIVCGRLEVPLNYQEPRGETALIAIPRPQNTHPTTHASAVTLTPPHPHAIHPAKVTPFLRGELP